MGGDREWASRRPPRWGCPEVLGLHHFMWRLNSHSAPSPPRPPPPSPAASSSRPAPFSPPPPHPCRSVTLWRPSRYILFRCYSASVRISRFSHPALGEPL